MTEANRVVPAGGPRWLPAWLQQYRREQAIQDGIAGLVVTVLLVPQSLAYAMLAGLPPQWSCTPVSCRCWHMLSSAPV